MMDLEMKHKLEELEAVTQENNEMLHKMHRAAVFRRIITIIKWILIVIFTMAGYYVLQPFVDSFKTTYQVIQDSVMEVRDVKDSLPDMSTVFKKGSADTAVPTN
jgi:hypothetical protein